MKIMASDLLALKHESCSKELSNSTKGTDGTTASPATLLGDPRTTGEISKFEKVMSNIKENIGILEFKFEGNQIL